MKKAALISVVLVYCILYLSNLSAKHIANNRIRIIVLKVYIIGTLIRNLQFSIKQILRNYHHD